MPCNPMRSSGHPSGRPSHRSTHELTPGYTRTHARTHRTSRTMEHDRPRAFAFDWTHLSLSPAVNRIKAYHRLSTDTPARRSTCAQPSADTPRTFTTRLTINTPLLFVPVPVRPAEPSNHALATYRSTHTLPHRAPAAPHAKTMAR
jgi:hypothetical protein